MKREIENLSRTEWFDCVVCDFLFPTPNIPDLVVRSVPAQCGGIWQRHVENVRTPAFC